MKISKFLTTATFIVASSFVAAQITLTAGPVSCSYKNKDLNDSYDQQSDVLIKCSGSSCTVTGTGATATTGLVTISTAGTYIVEGDLEGQLRIEATSNDFIHLVLNDSTITSSEGPAIYGVSADKVSLTLIGENQLTDSSNYIVVDEEPDACLFIDADLSINGSGSINITGNYGDAIRCKKDLKIIDGNITVPGAILRGIKAKNSICVKDGTIDVTSTDTGIKATRDDDPEKGFIVIDGGDISVSTGNKGIHSETHFTINGGFVDIKKCKEGLEGQMIDILGGEVHIVSQDDGINASEIKDPNDTSNRGGWGGMSSGNGSAYVNIVGGKTYITVQGIDTDGIDANGVLYIGGEAELYVSHQGGAIYGNMAALDADNGNSIVAGATVIATAGGDNGGMSGFPGGMGGGPPPNGMGMGQGGPPPNGMGMGQGGGFPGGNWSFPSNGTDQNGMPPPPPPDGNWSFPLNGTDQNGMPPPPPDGNWSFPLNGTDQNGMPPPPPDGGFPGGMGGGGPPPFNESGEVYQANIQTSVTAQEAGTEIIIKDSKGNIIASFTPIVGYSTILVTSPKLIVGETYSIVMGDTIETATAVAGAEGTVNSPSISSAGDSNNAELTTTEKASSTSTTTTSNSIPTTTTTTKVDLTPTNTKIIYNCSEHILKKGYKCCSMDCEIVFKDSDGTWGIENNEWCGCNEVTLSGCPATILSEGYPCCSENNCNVYYTDKSGLWGVEHKQWCGTPTKCS